MGSHRRLAFSSVLAAALVAATGAGAATIDGVPGNFKKIERGKGELKQPRVRPGKLTVPVAHRRGRIRVVVGLSLPPLAKAGLQSNALGASRRLNVESTASKAYLARIARAQAAAVAQLHRAIPEAKVQQRFGILLDGITVDLPTTKLPTLVKQPFANRVYPSIRYSLNTNRSPGVIAADQIWKETGAMGQGMKIGVVDDGVDPTNPFLSPTGFSYPAGFPRGQAKWVTPKIIVARAFPAPGAGAQGSQALFRANSFHGTHVSGIAAGDENTTAPAGPDHPTVTGLSGVAPKAWIGNYRVFSRPTAAGYDAFTPEIVQAFEAVVKDGMDVLNFSGGGPEIDPKNDALAEAANNVAAAGVVPVISAGNDRDEFGAGSIGTPSSAHDAISVAAVTDTHVFGAVLGATAAGAPAAIRQIRYEGAAGEPAPAAWAGDQTLIDPGTITGTNGVKVDRLLCGQGTRANDPLSTTLPAGSLQGGIALVFRGSCSFDSKARRARAAGAIGLIVADNRPGESTFIPESLVIPTGLIADLDGANLRDFLASGNGRTPIRVNRAMTEIVTGRSGTLMYFSSAGPATFDRQIKPDVAAPGGSIISSTLPEFARSPFAVFPGTSMAAPHVSGAATLLRQLHPGWTPAQVKSALVNTGVPAWADTARTKEAPVYFAGGGLINVPRANQPLLFMNPVSLSFDDLNVNKGAKQASLLITLTDANGGGGNWSVEVQPQTASTGASVVVPGMVTMAPGGLAFLPVAVVALANAAAGDNAGFIVLRRGSDTRRVPYAFAVTRPGIEGLPKTELAKFQIGSTSGGVSKVSAYRYPAGPFAQSFSAVSTPAGEGGAEKVYVFRLYDAAVNFGVSVLAQNGGVIDPFILGKADENTVQGYAGTPFGVNAFIFDYLSPVQAAATDFPRQGTYYVAVDSPRDVFTGQQYNGTYLLNAWVNDVTPPSVRVLTTRVAAGRPTLAFQTFDGGSGVDPYSLVIAYGSVLVGAAYFDPASGIALFPIPDQAPAIKTGKTPAIGLSYDFQETKNVDQAGENVQPNTNFKPIVLKGVKGPAVSWLLPDGRACTTKTTRLVVLAGSTGKLREVRFYDGKKRLAIVKKGTADIYAYDWKTANAKKGPHRLLAVAIDANGTSARAIRTFRVCK